MVINIYVIYDKAANVYNKPFYLHNDAIAERTARELLTGQDSTIRTTPSDFIMFRIGTYDDENCGISTHEPEPIVRFHEITAHPMDAPQLREA